MSSLPASQLGQTPDAFGAGKGDEHRIANLSAFICLFIMKDRIHKIKTWRLFTCNWNFSPSSQQLPGGPAGMPLKEEAFDFQVKLDSTFNSQ